ncbi:unnamed protein product [Linum trigynum]|uniref:Uncharacterized protein n=1 Tax=Linum trigynum TaxID=586398 RepID=A0AAV2DWC6_9ROSI
MDNGGWVSNHLCMPRQRMGEEVQADRIIRYTIHLEPVRQLQETGKMHPCLFILQAMKLDRGCNELNPAWLDLEVVRWDGWIEDDRADIGDPWSVVILQDGARRRWWLRLNPIYLGYGVVPQHLIHQGNLERYPLGRVMFSFHLVLFLGIAAQMAVYALLHSQSSSLLSPKLATGAFKLQIQRQ